MPRILLLLVTAVYFIRPSEWYPPLAGVPLYQCLVIPCMVFAADKLLRQVTSQALMAQPISACAIGMFIVALASNLVHPSSQGQWQFASTFGKAIVYYLLVVSLIDSERRLKRYLAALTVIIAMCGGLVALVHHGALGLGADAIRVMSGDVERVTFLGDASFDPNDLAAMLLLGAIPALGFAVEGGMRWKSLPWLALAAITVYCLYLTKSRGGMLALATALGVFAYFRWGARWSILLAAAAIPAGLAVLGGRMTDISSIYTGTGQTRIQLWTSALMLFKENPILGIGPENFTPIVGRASHNAFLQAYAELGFLGGTLFFGAFAYSVLTFHKLIGESRQYADESSRNLLAVLLALACGYAVASLALSLTYLTATYLLLGVNAAAIRLHRPWADIVWLPFGSRLLGRLAVASLGFLLAGHVFSRLMVNW